MRIDKIIFERINNCPERIAIVCKDKSWRYGELGERVNYLMNSLSNEGFCKGDRAVLWFENSAEYIIAYLSVLALEGVVVSLHHQVPVTEISRIIGHVNAKCLIISSSILNWEINDFEHSDLKFVIKENEIFRLNKKNNELLKLNLDLAQIIFTSGSTGKPKGVMLSHKNLISNTYSILSYLKLTEKDSIVAVLPFVYAYGNSVMLTHLFAGGRIFIENNIIYPNLILDKMLKEEITGFSGVASTYAILINQSNLKAYTFPSLRYLTNAGGPISIKLLSHLQSIFRQKDIFLMYGQTEATARLTYLPPENINLKRGSAGRAIPGVLIKIVKENGETAAHGELGEIWAFGENIMQGYWADPENTARVLSSGWLCTGDIGKLDEDGYLYIFGRNNEMIKSGAFRISPSEIEEILLLHPGVYEASIVGVEDDVMGEIICGLVVPKKEHRLTSQELLAHCFHHLPHYKMPKRISLVDALPKSTSGKILRQKVREISRELIIETPLRARNIGANNVK